MLWCISAKVQASGFRYLSVNIGYQVYCQNCLDVPNASSNVILCHTACEVLCPVSFVNPVTSPGELCCINQALYVSNVKKSIMLCEMRIPGI